MQYKTCPTCGYFLGQKTYEWEIKSNEICNNPNLSNDEKEKKKQDLLLSLNLKRYCCKMRMMSYVKLVDIILPIPSNK
jgi:DNA-directed RNA polymerase subunit N (RpoN/RPB10)